MLKTTVWRIAVAVVLCGALAVSVSFAAAQWQRFSSSEVEFMEPEDEPLSPSDAAYWESWQRPPGPPRVGLQIGHWKNAELPDELEHIRERGGGTQWNGLAEREAMLDIGRRVKVLLEKEGMIVDVLPATVPPQYLADAFVSLHADGSESSQPSGYKVSPPRRDLTRKAGLLSDMLQEAYGAGTKLALDPNITANMRGYYAFNWRRRVHAIHPMTPAAILETGFLTSSVDRRIIVSNPDISARAIAEGVIRFVAETVPLPEA